jgi:acetylornithine deacetylase/succinyl-diaminopimelate desuccinylase-like protein
MSTDVVTLLQRLAACNTSNPPGNEAQAVAILEELLVPAGVECERVAKDPGRPNLVARLRGRGGGPSLAFLGHSDVVQARREDWTVEPFAGIVREGAVWGRGTVDMKSQVAATAVALATLAREGFQPNGDLILIVVADEEVGEAAVGMPFLIEQRPDLAPDFLIGEGAGERFQTPQGPVYLVDCGVKCTTPGELVTTGTAGDASLAGNGDNALLALARLLDHFDRHPPEHRITEAVRPLLDLFSADGSPGERVAAVRAANPALGEIAESLTTNVFIPTTAQSRSPSNVVPDRAQIELYGATLPGLSKDELERELRRRFGGGNYQLEVSQPEGGLSSDTDTPLFHAIEGFISDRDPGARVLPTLGYGYSDCHLMREKHGSVAYGFIPFRHADPATNLHTKHGPDEHVLIEDLHFQLEAALAVARRIGAA